MKTTRLIALMLAMTLLLALSACGQKNEVMATDPTTSPTQPTSPTQTPAPTQEPEPKWEPGIVRASYIGGLFELFQRGDEVTVLGEWEGYFLIQGDDMPLFVEKQFLRPETEEAPEEYQAYTKNQTTIHTTGYLREKAIATLGLNTKVTVLDAKGTWALIRLEDGSEGYTAIENISKWYIGGNSGGGNSGGSNSSKGTQDGTDVNLGNISFTGNSARVTRLSNVQQPEYEEYEVPVSGMILSAETEAYAYMFMRDTELKVTEVTESLCTVWVNDLFVTVPRWTLRMEGDALYEAWTAYGRSGAAAYTEIQKWHKLLDVTMNQKIEVVDELAEIGMYVIKVDNSYGYISMDMLSTTQYTAPSNGSSGHSGGGGNSGSTGWTPPVL